MSTTNFPYNLRRLRKLNGLTQNDVAKRIGVSENTIVNYEGGFSRPNENRLLVLSKLFDVTPALLKGTLFASTDHESAKKDFTDFLWKVRELESDEVQLRIFLLENMNQMSNELLNEAITLIFRKNLRKL